jgi:hypothetical protein
MTGKMDKESDQWMLKVTRNGQVMATVGLNGHDLRKPAARGALVDELVSKLGLDFVRQIAEGGAPGLKYALDYREVQGIMVPTKRRVYAYDAQKQKVSAPLLVAIDIHEIAFDSN